MATPTKVNVWEALNFECPNCCEENTIACWAERGDKVKCKHCGHISQVAEHYADCRPPKVPSPLTSS